MKFGKTYQSYQTRLHESADIPSRFAQVDYRALKKILKRCLSSRAHGTTLLLVGQSNEATRACDFNQLENSLFDAVNPASPVNSVNSVNSVIPVHSVIFDAVKPAAGCPHCDGEFFKLLEEELRSIERSFTREAARVISCHNAHGLSAILSRFSDYSKPEVMYCAASSLLEHLALSYLATRKIVKKYIKVHSAPISTGLDEEAGAEGHQSVENEGIGGSGGNAERLEGIRMLQQRILRSPLMLELTALLSNLSYALEQKQLKLQAKQQQQQQQHNHSPSHAEHQRPQQNEGEQQHPAGPPCPHAQTQHKLSRGERREQQQRQQLFGCSAAGAVSEHHHHHLHRHCHDPRCPGFDLRRSQEHRDGKWRYQHLRWLHILAPMQSTWTGGGASSGVFSGRLPWSPVRGAGEERHGQGFPNGGSGGSPGGFPGRGSFLGASEVREQAWSDDEESEEEGEEEDVSVTRCDSSMDLFEYAEGSTGRDQRVGGTLGFGPQSMTECGDAGAGDGGESGGGESSIDLSSGDGQSDASEILLERGAEGGCNNGDERWRGGGGVAPASEGLAEQPVRRRILAAVDGGAGNSDMPPACDGAEVFSADGPVLVNSDGLPERLAGQEQEQQQQQQQQQAGSEPVLELQLRPEFHAHVEFKCPVCLDVFFDPIALACGHIYCRSCASSVAKVPAFEDIRMASPHIPCPVCRQANVFGQMVSLKELHRLIMARQPEQWRERRDEELKQRREQERKYMDEQMRIALKLY
ncbi:hypothetical protein CLOM_g9694 [Closterium sp. NIES-68]|nr:hypothetical protein CLOM_g9694 [Closterium sp. NIES-68]GJP58545.1 hypothetical protein CLOP_g398 [Closterium sp. NIES-67]